MDKKNLKIRTLEEIWPEGLDINEQLEQAESLVMILKEMSWIEDKDYLQVMEEIEKAKEYNGD